MIQPQTQMLDIYRASMRTAADLAKASLENAEKLQNRQLQIVRNALEENAKSASDLAQVKSLDEMMALQTRLASSQMERMIDFWSGLWRTAGDSQMAMIGQLQGQVEQMRERFRETYNLTADLTSRTTESAARIAASQVQSVAERQAGERRPEQPQHRKSA
ncbi:MAG TPA: phasin family protein [Burkholderiales bacterium]